MRNEALVAYHYYNIKKCDDLNLTPRKTAVFHAIMAEMLELMKRRSAVCEFKGVPITVEEALGDFKKLMISHCAALSPDTCCEFTDSDARMLSDYAMLSFFNHFLLYQYVLLFPREEENLEINMKVPSKIIG